MQKNIGLHSGSKCGKTMQKNIGLHSGSKCGKTMQKNFEVLKMVRVAQHINKPEITFHLNIILR